MKAKGILKIFLAGLALALGLCQSVIAEGSLTLKKEDCKVEPASATVGSMIRLTYVINNSSSSSKKAALGASIRLSSGSSWASDSSNDVEITVPAFASNYTYSRPFAIPIDCPVGQYNVWFALRDGFPITDSSGTYDSYEKASCLTITLKELFVTLISDKTSYAYNQNIYLTAKVKNSSDAWVSGASVVFDDPIKGAPATSTTDSDGKAYYTTKATKKGIFTFKVTVSKTGFYPKTAQLQITVTNTAPTVTITSPANNATVSGTTAISVSAVDPEDGAVDKFEFYIDGQLKHTDDNNVSSNLASTWNWDTITYADGIHQIRAAAYDFAGDSSSSTISVTIKNPPIITVATDKSAYYLNDIVNFTITVKDRLGARLAGKEVKVDDPALGNGIVVGQTDLNGEVRYKSFASANKYVFSASGASVEYNVSLYKPLSVTVSKNFSGCYLEDSPSFSINVKDPSGAPVQDADVYVDDPYKKMNHYIGKTDSSGRLSYSTIVKTIFDETFLFYARKDNYYAPRAVTLQVKADPRDIDYSVSLPAGYSIFSVPKEFGQKFIAAIFPSPPELIAYWNPQNKAYSIYPKRKGYAALDILETNKAYIAYSSKPITVNRYAKEIGKTTVSLEPGWNLIGNSLVNKENTDIPVSAISILYSGAEYPFENAIACGYIKEEIYELLPSGQYRQTKFLKRGRGYYIYANRKCELNIYFVNSPYMISIGKENFQAIMDKEHSLKFDVHVPSGTTKISITANTAAGNEIELKLYNKDSVLLASSVAGALSIVNPPAGMCYFVVKAPDMDMPALVNGVIKIYNTGRQYGLVEIIGNGINIRTRAAWGFYTGRCELGDFICMSADIGVPTAAIIFNELKELSRISDIAQAATNSFYAGAHTNLCFLGGDKQSCEALRDDLINVSLGIVGYFIPEVEVELLLIKILGYAKPTTDHLKNLEKFYGILSTKKSGGVIALPDSLEKIKWKRLGVYDKVVLKPGEHSQKDLIAKKYWTAALKGAIKAKKPEDKEGVIKMTEFAKSTYGLWQYTVVSPTFGTQDVDVVGYIESDLGKEYFVMVIKNFEKADVYNPWVGEWDSKLWPEINSKLQAAHDALTGNPRMADKVHKILVSAGNLHPSDVQVESLRQNGIVVIKGIPLEELQTM